MTKDIIAAGIDWMTMQQLRWCSQPIHYYSASGEKQAEGVAVVGELTAEYVEDDPVTVEAMTIQLIFTADIKDPPQVGDYIMFAEGNTYYPPEWRWEIMHVAPGPAARHSGLPDFWRVFAKRVTDASTSD